MKAYFPSLFSGKYLPLTCAHKEMPGGQNISPVLSWGEVPKEARSFVLILTDMHPSMQGWVYWYVINVPGSARGIQEEASMLREKLPTGSLEMRNSYGDLGYGGPKLTLGSEPHTLNLTVHALSVPLLSIGPYAKPEERERALEGNILATATATAIFVPAG